MTSHLTSRTWPLVVAVALVAGLGACKKQEAPATENHAAAPAIPAAELKRGADACKAYVDKVCGCVAAVPTLKAQCGLARALPDALEVGQQVTVSPESAKLDVLHAQDLIRKTVRECIEQTAKLPSLGCS